MTYEEAVKKIETKFAKADASKLSDFAVQITLTDEDCSGILYVQVNDGKITVQPYDYRDNDAAVTISFKDLTSSLDRCSFTKLFESGKASVTGDAQKLEDLKAAIKAGKPAPAVKKTTTKAAEVKAETKTAATAKKEPVKKTAAKTTAKETVTKKAAAKKTAK